MEPDKNSKNKNRENNNNALEVEVEVEVDAMSGGHKKDTSGSASGVGEYEKEECRKEQIRRLIELQALAGELGDIPSTYIRTCVCICLYVCSNVCV